MREFVGYLGDHVVMGKILSVALTGGWFAVWKLRGEIIAT
jgi:hypothetical protein